MEFQASYHQERLWFIDRFETGNVYPHPPIYHNVPLGLEIEGEIQADLLRESFRLLVHRHEALRTSIITRDEKPVQSVKNSLDADMPILDCSSDSDDDPVFLMKLVRRLAAEPFNIASGPLIRANLVRRKSRLHFLILVTHHVVVDRRSLEIIASELMEIYQILEKGDRPSLAELPLQFADFSQWQRQLPPQALEANLLYWRRKLKGKIQALELPVDFPRTPIHVYEEEMFNFRVPGSSLEIIKNLWKDKDDTVLLLAVFKSLMHRYSANTEIVIGTTSTYRQQPGTSNVVGPLANLLVLRSHLEETLSFRELVEQLKRTIDDALKHQDLPFDKLVAELKPDVDMSRTALFDVLFNIGSTPPVMSISDSTKVKWIETNSGWGKYDINLLLLADGSGYQGYLSYNSLLFQESFISQLVRHYLVLLERVAAWADRPLSLIPVLTDDEASQVLTVWNGTSSPYPEDQTLVGLLSDVVGKNCDRIALVCGDEALSYQELGLQSSRLASYLYEKNGVREGDLVALSMEPSLDLLIGLLGILKCGAAYVPIDPSQPKQRIRYVLEDSNCMAQLTGDLASERASFLAIGKDTFREALIKPEDPAYVIYTSGTTGRPKGCIVSHRNVVRLFKCSDFPFDFGMEDTWILAHAASFDFSIWEIFGALLFSGRLVVVSRENVRAVDRFLRILERHKVTVLNQTPRAFAALSAVAKANEYGQLARHLRYVVFGGDRLELNQLKDWVSVVSLDSVRLINMFGITETTVHVTYYAVTEEDVFNSNGASPIGKPLPETTVYLLNPKLNFQPPGVNGEIYVGGSGVALGYLNRPELTNERFIENPYKSGERLYSSGDLGSWLPDGSLRYGGRLDGQVKIRGFRIETGEIQQQILKYKGVREVVVQMREDRGDRYLVAYFIALGIVDPENLRAFLLKLLPDYMAPSQFMQLEEFPLTQNGKLNYAALPEPDFTQQTEIVKPRDEVELKLVEIWAEILKMDAEAIGINTSFFDLGGHSLNATLMVTRIHKELDVKIAIAEVFRTPFIKDLAEIVQASSSDWFTSILPAEKKDFYELSSAQHRFFIMHNMDPASLAYNMPFVQKIGGPINLRRLELAFENVVHRHESLRTAFLFIEGKAVQRVFSQVEFKVEYFESDEDGAQHIIANFLKPFDLALPPLMRLGFITLEPESHILMLDMHHIICDGISLSVFVNDLLAFYDGTDLEPPKLQYKDFAQWQRRMLESGALRRKQEFWTSLLGGDLPMLTMPTDFPRPEIHDSSGASFVFVLDSDQTGLLNELIADTGTTLYMVLLTLFTMLLCKYSGQTDIIVGTPIAGRDHADLSGIIGLLIETLVTRNHPHPDKSFLQYLDEVKKHTLDVYENQGFPFGEILKLAFKENDRSRNPLFDVMLVVQNFDTVASNGSSPEGGELNVTPFSDGGSRVSKVDITLQATETDGVILFTLEYCTALFLRQTMDRFATAFQTLIASVLQNRNIRLREIDLSLELAAAETQQYSDVDSEFHF